METRNLRFPVVRGAAPTDRGSPPRAAGSAGAVGGVRPRPATDFLRLLLWQAGGIGVVAAGIALDGVLRPSPGIELIGQAGAFFAALLLSWRGLARFVPDLDRRWRVSRKIS